MWITKMTQAEADYYSHQPTAQALLEKTLRDSTYIPEGDKAAATAFVAQRDAAKAARQAGTQAAASAQTGTQSAAKGSQSTAQPASAGYDVVLSSAAQSLQSSGTQALMTAADQQLLGHGASRKLRFTSSSAVQQALKDGYVELNGQQYYLTDDMKKSLAAQDKAQEKLRQGIMNMNMLRQDAVAAQRNGESMQKACQKQSRIMQTAMRIMHGRKVSPADEKELAQAAPDLYNLAKSAGELEKHKLTRKEKEEDEKISKQNDEDRDWEESPSAIPDAVDTPVPEYNVEVDMPDSGVDVSA